MKKIILLSFALIITFFVSGNVNAQEKAQTKISSVTQKGETVRYSLTSSKPFIVGNNRYILRIGDKDFFRYEQSDNKGSGSITFLIPENDFNALAEGNSVYLTYGKASEDADMEGLAKKSPRCWLIGKFSKDILTK
jgi:hypothetical protein